jgi:hypothetical protein
MRIRQLTALLPLAAGSLLVVGVAGCTRDPVEPVGRGGTSQPPDVQFPLSKSAPGERGVGEPPVTRVSIAGAATMKGAPGPMR